MLTLMAWAFTRIW